MPYLSSLLLMTALTHAVIEPREPRTLAREIDPVVITGDCFGDFLGVDKKNVRVYALRGGVFGPIPYQVDERLPDGEYAYDSGEKAAEDTDKGRIDANDELVFLASDLGGRVTRSVWPEGHGGGLEIAIRDPRDGARGWAYLLAFRDPPAPSPLDYVESWTGANGVSYVRTNGYLASNERYPENASRLTNLQITHSANEAGAINVMDSSKLRVAVEYKFIRIQKDVTQFATRQIGLIDGPVRVLTRNEVKMYLFLGLWLPSPESVGVSYPWGYEVPNKVNVPVSPNEGSGSSVRITFDFNPGDHGRFFYSDQNPNPVIADGIMSDAESKLNLTLPRWTVSSSSNGTMITHLALDPALQARARLYYKDDASLDDAPEYHKGAFGEVGYWIGIGGQKPGDYLVKFVAILLREFSAGDEARYLPMIEAPLEYELRPPLS